MTKKNLPLFKYILISILLIISNPMLGQETPLRLISDTISYDKMSENLSATGNVKVIYEKTTLSAEKIRYDKKNDKLSIIGNFTINDGENIIISDNDAIINTKFRNGLIKGARAIINEKLQISAQSLNQKDVNYNIFNTVVASTCEICASNPTPFWQIRARKIIHDKEKQKIFFENARLDFLGLPILYIPALNIPEPGIERASGVLVPQFSTSDKVGFSAKLPYYIALDNNKDLTLTPFVMSKNSLILETEYRQFTKNGFF
ncbi:LPS-assembly protein LptD, partial [Amylibacter sp.]|nr:LPS-assembly protein LptD [Amylibacter sp.]